MATNSQQTVPVDSLEDVVVEEVPIAVEIRESSKLGHPGVVRPVCGEDGKGVILGLATPVPAGPVERRGNGLLLAVLNHHADRNGHPPNPRAIAVRVIGRTCARKGIRIRRNDRSLAVRFDLWYGRS